MKLRYFVYPHTNFYLLPSIEIGHAYSGEYWIQFGWLMWSVETRVFHLKK